MIAYCLRLATTGEYMPAKMTRTGARGWSHWPELKGFGGSPRLFDTERGARTARIHWAKGPVDWEYFGGPFEQQSRAVAKDIGRKRTDLEIVQVNLIPIKIIKE